jgi:hypothetical protein
MSVRSGPDAVVEIGVPVMGVTSSSVRSAHGSPVVLGSVEAALQATNKSFGQAWPNAVAVRLHGSQPTAAGILVAWMT